MSRTRLATDYDGTGRTRLATPVTIRLRASDGARRTWTFKTVEGLRRWHADWLGTMYDTTWNGYVGGYGDTVFEVSGMTVAEVERTVKGSNA